MSIIIEALNNPIFWATNILLFILLPMVAGMLFGGPKNTTKNKTWVYRETGVEIVFVLFPFLLYSIAHLLNGSYSQFLLTPELPMAAMIISAITIFTLIKSAFAAKDTIPVGAFLVLSLSFLAIFMSCAGLVFWLTLKTNISPWFSVLNCIVLIFSLLLSFGASAALNYATKHPDEFGVKSN